MGRFPIKTKLKLHKLQFIKIYYFRAGLSLNLSRLGLALHNFKPSPSQAYIKKKFLKKLTRKKKNFHPTDRTDHPVGSQIIRDPKHLICHPI